jgi:DNA-binding transcriptional regulator YhcF (GntR family)
MIRSAFAFLCRSFKAISALHGGDRRAAFAFLVFAQLASISFEDGPAIRKLSPSISVHALAHSLVIPYETMRRSVAVLIESGLCERNGRESVVLCSNPKTHAAVTRLRETMTDQLQWMLRDLNAIGFRFQGPVGAVQSGAMPARLSADAVEGDRGPPIVDLAHAAGALFLRLVEVSGPLHQHDILCTMVFVAIVSKNLAHITHDKAVTWQYGSIDRPPPDDMRKAVSVRAIADMLGLSVETTRRCVCQLIDNGECIRKAGQGVIVPAGVLARNDIVELAMRTALRVDQTLAELVRCRFDFEILA